jgi:hypothetical protein
MMHTLVLRGNSSRKENTTAQRIHLLLQEFKNDFYEKVDILRHHPVVPWLEDYIEEVEKSWGKIPGSTASLKTHPH